MRRPCMFRGWGEAQAGVARRSAMRQAPPRLAGGGREALRRYGCLQGVWALDPAGRLRFVAARSGRGTAPTG